MKRNSSNLKKSSPKNGIYDVSVNNKAKKYCIICKRDNHNTEECRKLPKVQQMFSNKPRDRSSYGNSSDNNYPSSGGYQPRYHDNNNISSYSSNQVSYNNYDHYYDDSRRVSYPQSIHYTDHCDESKRGYIPKHQYQTSYNRGYP